MDIATHSNQAVAARKTIIELLLASHPDDCLYCPGNGTCVLQRYAQELGVRQRSYSGARNRIDLDVSSPSIIRDPEKCILCGRCVRVCSEVQGVSAIDFTGRGSSAQIGCAFNEGLNVSSCVNCGQCVMVCPTGALTERRDVDRVLKALDDPSMTVVVQHAPAVSVTLAEEFGIKPGSDIVDETIIGRWIDAGADIVLLPAPGTVPGISAERVRDLIGVVHVKGALAMTAIGTSQEGSDEATIRQIALWAKSCGADLHHIGDSGYPGIAVPENILAYSIVIRGRRHAWRRMAASLAR